MKHTRLYSCLLAVIMLVVASATALAQEFAYTTKSATFLKPGEKGTIAVSLNNTESFRSLQGKIVLPEGLTFVTKDADKGRMEIAAAERTKDAAAYLQAKDEHTAVFLITTGGTAAGEGEVFEFAVQAAATLPIADQIAFSSLDISLGAGKPVAHPADFSATVCNAEYELMPAVSPVKIAKGEEQTVSFGMSFGKVLSAVQFDIVMPEGLNIVDGSFALNTDRCPNHKVSCKNNHVVVYVKQIDESRDFNGLDGDICSFKVTADEAFKSGDIQFVNIKAVVTDENGNTLYYGGDTAASVELDNATGINGVSADEMAEGADGIYQLNGVRTSKMQRGVNIVIKDGKAVKVVKK